MDPFKQAFQVKHLKRVNSVDRVYRDKMALEALNKVNSKTVLQSCSSPSGDVFLQTFQGDTLRWKHDDQESKREWKRHLIQERGNLD